MSHPIKMTDVKLMELVQAMLDKYFFDEQHDRCCEELVLRIVNDFSHIRLRHRRESVADQEGA